MIDLGSLGFTINIDDDGQPVSVTFDLPDGSSVTKPYGNGEFDMRRGMKIALAHGIAKTAPAQFGTGDWSVADAETGGDITITITARPSDGGSAITDLEYQIDGGSWVSLSGTTTGAYPVSGLTDDVEVDVAIRAVNAIGNGTASATKAVTPTTAVNFFPGGEVGVWYDPSDLSTVFADSAMTTPASVDGVVGAIMDKSGNGKHALQSGADNFKPILRLDAGKYSLEFDGIDDFLVTSAINFTVTDAVTAGAAVLKESDAATGMLLEIGSGVASAFSFRAPHLAAATFAFASTGQSGSAAIAGSPANFASPITAVLLGQADISADQCILRINGVQEATSATNQGINNYNSLALFVGRRGGISLPYNGHLYGVVIRAAASDATMVGSMERWLANRSGVTL